MKQFITQRVMSVAVMMLLAVTVMASDYTDGNGLEYTLDATAKTATVVAKTSGTYTGAITIPSAVTVDGTEYAVTTIGEKAFYDCCGSITSLTIPASITTIEDKAFSGSSNTNKVGIHKVYITDLEAYCKINFVSQYGYSSPFYYYNASSTSITNHLYLNGTEITEFNIPEGVTTIGAFAFWGCKKITKVTIPASLTKMGTCAFSGCTGLKEVHISDMKAWCEMDFGNKANPLSATTNAGLYLNGDLVTELVIPEGTTSVNERAFYNYTKLTSVSFPSTLKSIGNNAFYGCKNIKTLYFASENPPTIAAKASFKNVSPTNVYVPEAYKDNYSSLKIGNTTPSVTECKYSVATKSVCWATGCFPEATSVPSGTKAYYISSVSDNWVTLSEFPEADGKHIIPANCGFIFNSAEGTHLFPTYSGTAESVSNCLTGVPFGGDAVTVEANSVYVLSYLTDSSVMGMYLYSGTTIDANHAYMAKSVGGNYSKSMSFNFNETSGITPTVVEKQLKNAAIYNLQGQRVSRTQSGNIYIKGGKKFIAK